MMKIDGDGEDGEWAFFFAGGGELVVKKHWAGCRKHNRSIKIRKW